MKHKKRYSFEEYAMYFQTTEKVIDRRIAFGKFSYSIGTTILIAIAVIGNWCIKNPDYQLFGLSIIITLSVFATIYTKFWVAQIEIYKGLNGAKFQVIESMAKRLKFENEEANKVISYKPFLREWEILRQQELLEENDKLKLQVLNSSTYELFVPKAFQVIFILVSLVSLSVLIYGHFLLLFQC